MPRSSRPRGERLKAQRASMQSESASRAGGQQYVQHIVPRFSRINMHESTAEFRFDDHQHKNYEVIVVDRGKYYCELNGQPFELGKGEGIVVKPGDIHSDICRPPLIYFAVVFVLESELSTVSDSPALFAKGAPPSMQRFAIDMKSVHPVIDQIDAESTRSDMLSANVQDALLLQFFWQLVRVLPAGAVSEEFLDLSYRQAFPTKLMRVLRANISKSLGLSEIAGLMGISESSLSHKCKDLLGTSPARAFMKCKMDRAMHLLANSSMLVKEIAFELGFTDAYSFTRAFTRHFGQAPSAYRPANGNG